MKENIFRRVFYSSQRAKAWQAFVFIILLVLISSMIDFGTYYNRASKWIENKTNQAIKLPETKEVPFRLGLDLLGGTHLVYQADVADIPNKDRVAAVEGVRDVIERRVNVFGVSEPVVQTNRSGEDYRVIVELAGVKDVGEAIQMIGETPLLEFKEQGPEERGVTEEEIMQMDEYNRQAKIRADEVLEKVLAGEDFASLAKEYSDDQSTKENGGSFDWMQERQNQGLVAIAKDLEVGNTTRELVEDINGYEIIRLDDKRNKTNPFTEEAEKEVKASHILICHNEAEACDSGLSKDEAYEKIKNLKDKANPDNFIELARENSTEPGAAGTGGDLGWFGKNEMVKPFEDTVFSQEIGTISYIVETKFGYHIIYKQDERDIVEYKISHILIATMDEDDILGGDQNWKNTELTGKNLDRAEVQFDPNDNTPQVALKFDSEGSDLFAQITGRNVGDPVAIFLDGYPISIPTVNEKITGGEAVISGNFNIKEAKLLAQRLNAGALPVPINLINQQTIGASLGQKSVEDSLRAGIIGLILVAIFMLIVYRLPGFLSVFSLLVYGIILLAIFKLWPVTLTLSGLAGVILSIGMAVDANVLIFERIKEELRDGKPLAIAIEEGFKRAWTSIRDGNVSTLITCFILMQFSTSIVKGFAVTLFVGVVISMFTAIVVTRNFLRLTESEWLEKRLWLLGK